MTGRVADRRRIVILAAAGVLLVLLFVQLGPSRIVNLLATLRGGFPVLVLLFGCHECVRAAALARCFVRGEQPAYGQLLRVRLLGEAVGTLTRTGAFAAEPARAVLLAGRTGLGTGAYAASIAELVANSSVSAVVTLCVAGFVLNFGIPGTAGTPRGAILVLAHVLLWSSLVYLSAVTIAVAARVNMVSALVRGVRRLAGPRGRPERARDGVRAVEGAVLGILAHRSERRTQLMLLEFLAQAILISEVYWAIRSMGVAAGLGDALLLEVLMKAPNIIQFMGVTEAGYAVIFSWFGMTAAVGFTLSLVKLLRTLVTTGIGLGLLNRFAPIDPALALGPRPGDADAGGARVTA